MREVRVVGKRHQEEEKRARAVALARAQENQYLMPS
jgi:hypothetical protein